MSLSVGLLARDSTRIKGRNGSRIVGMRSEDRDKFQGEGEGHWFPPELSLWGGVGWVDQLYVDCRAGVLLESYWVRSLMTHSTPPHPPPPPSTDLSAALQSTNSWSTPPHNNTSGRNHCPPPPEICPGATFPSRCKDSRSARVGTGTGDQSETRFGVLQSMRVCTC